MTHPDDPEHARFAELNALAGVLPYHRRDELSALLSDADVATLRHLVESGMGANTLRAIASDLAYLERWALAATGALWAVGALKSTGPHAPGAIRPKPP